MRHPNIVTTYGFEKLKSQELALVLEYVPGENLKDIIPLISHPDRPCVASSIFKTVGEALLLAHQKNIIHGDVSSRNVLISNDGQIKLSDFGQSRKVDDSLDLGAVRGSVDYLSVERWDGEGTSQASDIFALGLVTYEVLTGSHPYGDSKPYKLSDLQSFLIRKPWQDIKNWSHFFDLVFLGTLDEKKNLSLLLTHLPLYGRGRLALSKTLRKQRKSSPRDIYRTSTLIIGHLSQRLKNLGHKFAVLPLLRPILASLLFFTPAAIGLDHTMTNRRLGQTVITLTSLPWGEVFLDNKSIGFTPLYNFPILPGLHSFLWLDKEGHRVEKAINDYGNAVLAYRIVRGRGNIPLFSPLMNPD